MPLMSRCPHMSLILLVLDGYPKIVLRTYISDKTSQKSGGNVSITAVHAVIIMSISTN